jgi:hypothetical protein
MVVTGPGRDKSNLNLNLNTRVLDSRLAFASGLLVELEHLIILRTYFHIRPPLCPIFFYLALAYAVL